ncbi:hypothetical protein ENC20_05285 [Acinetobacter indicus]|nr:hypothetical protein ENC20_05285 [Acinetobacter indicus]
MNKTLLSLAVILSMALTGCGGGGGSDSNTAASSNPFAPAPVTPTSPGSTPDTTPVTASLINDVRFADLATEFSAQTFGLDSWNPKAMVVHQDILYVANDSAEASILRYDLKAKRVLSSIHAQNISGIGRPWNRLFDLSVHNDRLHAASYSSNRVDVFDLGSGEPQFLMSLGTGSWSGDQHNTVVVHPMSVAANDQYVFATDTHSRINVWKQSEISSTNHLKAKKYARLSLPNCGYNCSARLEAVGNLLYASFNNGMSYVYDLTHLEEGATNVAATRQENVGTRVFHAADDQRFYAAHTSGRIDSSALPNTQNLQNIFPAAEESFYKYRTAGASTDQQLAGALDIQVSQEHLFSLFNGKIVMMPLKRLQQFQSNTAATVTALKQQQAQSRSYVLQDGESWETLTNENLRHFYMDNILSANLQHQLLALQSYSAAPVRDLEIHARLKDTEQWFVLARLDHLDAFSQVKLKLNINENMHFPLLQGTGSVQLRNLGNFQQLPADLLELKISSATDPHVQKLMSLKPKWKIHFGNFAPETHGNWGKITPAYAREWVIMITNFAYLVNSPEFKHIWFNHKAVMGHDFFGNKGQVVGDGGYFTAAEYQKYYDEIMNRGKVTLGVTTVGGGLGGRNVLGVDTWLFYAHYFNTSIGIVGHEFGHHWGGHDSAWAKGGYGLQEINQQLHQYLQRKQRLPYMDPELNKFHLTPRAELYNGVAENMRRPRPDSHVNHLERYFAANPLPETNQP